MKRSLISFLLLIVIISNSFLFASCHKDLDSESYFLESPHCKAFFVSIPDTNHTEYAGENEKIFPASITKLLTALTALDILQHDTLITPGDEVYLVPNNSTIAYIRPNHTLTLEMLIEGMLLPSGGDAAYAIAAACGKVLLNNENALPEESVPAFVEAMNRKAAELGCTDSNFSVPDGYDSENNYSSCHDLFQIALAAFDCDVIRKYSSVYSDSVVYASGHTNTWTNTNKLLNPDSEYYRSEVIGLKTGSLDNNYSIIIAATVDSKEVLIGVFGSQDDSGRYIDVIKLLDNIE